MAGGQCITGRRATGVRGGVSAGQGGERGGVEGPEETAGGREGADGGRGEGVEERGGGVGAGGRWDGGGGEKRDVMRVSVRGELRRGGKAEKKGDSWELTRRKVGIE